MSALTPLSFLIAQNRDEQPPVEPIIPFDGSVAGATVRVTALLERTAAYYVDGDRYDTHVIRHDQVLVDPDRIEWRTRTSDSEGNRLREQMGKGRMSKHRQPSSKSPWHQTNGQVMAGDQERRAQLAKTDERALANRQQIKAQEERQVQFLRRRSAEQAAGKEKEEVSIYPQSTTITDPIGTVTKDPGIQVVDDPQHAHSVTSSSDAPEPTRKVKLRHCHRCGVDKPKNQFKTKRGKGLCNECRAKPQEKVGRAVSAPRVLVAEIPPDGTAVELNAKPKRKYTRRAKAGKRGGRRKKVATTAAVLSTGHRNGRPSLTFKELIERIVGERDALKARVDELEAERAQAFAQLQEVLG